MDDKQKIRLLMITSLATMYLHPGNRDEFEQQPTACLRKCQNIADLILLVESEQKQLEY